MLCGSVWAMFKRTAIVCSRLKFQRLFLRLHNSFGGIPRLKVLPKPAWVYRLLRLSKKEHNNLSSILNHA